MSEHEQTVSREERPTLDDPLLAAAAEEVKRAGLTGPERAAVYEVVDNVRHRRDTAGDSGLDAARLVLAAAGRDTTPPRSAEVLRRVAPRLVTGRVRR